MTIPAGPHRLGPGEASLVVQTYREGVAGKVGHDLIIDVQRWEATLDGGAEPTLELTADAGSLYPREGLRGLKPLSDRDRREIVKNIEGKVLGGQPIAFRSTSVREDGERLSVDGELTMNGATRPASFELTVDPGGELTGTTELTQSNWGISPYRGLMGALKVRDSLEVVFSGRLPAG
ncbi:MAG TPA: YceI family protein [Solirubrobacteraceae bacterium]